MQCTALARLQVVAGGAPANTGAAAALAPQTIGGEPDVMETRRCSTGCGTGADAGQALSWGQLEGNLYQLSLSAVVVNSIPLSFATH